MTPWIFTGSPKSSARAWPSSASSKGGLHVNEDHFYPEVINPETGEPVAPGQTGELVFTTLTKEALPLLRYRTAGPHLSPARAVRLRADAAPDEARDRAQRRYADHPRA